MSKRALWAHHPTEVRAAIRRFGFRPQAKQCFANCQRFVTQNNLDANPLDVEYREGYITVIIPLEHAWLLYKGEILDLTLGPDRDIQYNDSFGYSAADIWASCGATGMWTIINERRLWSLHPMRAIFEELKP